MRRPRSIATLADIIVLAFVALLNPLGPFHPSAPRPVRIPDKVEIRYTRQLPQDSLVRTLQSISQEQAEMGYYFRVHNVTDDGYNLVAQYNTKLSEEHRQLTVLSQRNTPKDKAGTTCITIPARQRPMVAVRHAGGFWKAGRFVMGQRLNGKGIARDWKGRIVSAVFDHDTIVTAIRIDEQGIYRGQMDSCLLACGQGTLDEWDGCHKEGFWSDDHLNGFGFDSSPSHQLRAGVWKDGKFLGEKLKYTTERIYGIDISRHQHEKGRKRYGIDWQRLRITSLGKRHQTDGKTFPVSFIYIKATEGTTVRNRYYKTDYLKAIRTGIHVGAYHFFSLKSTAKEQAEYFLRNAAVRRHDFPPVLDVEPTDAQIRQIGGDDELMRRIRIWMQVVERRTGKRPILYVSQSFVNNHMKNAADIKQQYNVWIARYGQYKPDVKLVYWQLCPDGRVDGITGPVDINVFNGYQNQFDEFIKTGFHK